MGTNSRNLNEHGYALCGVCRKKFFVDELEGPCEFCGRWFCRNCAREVPAGHGHGKICVRCHDKLRKSDKR